MFKGALEMKNNIFEFKSLFIVIFCLFGYVHFAGAKENIIQQENMSFEQCLKVISTSEDKLSIPPKITNNSDHKSSAVFTLSDGILTITCDGQKSVVTVTTEMD
tara:strand:- start:121 stop:432 length:312 start_codon:yes stop_codon:yes gene_type:complete